MPHGLHAHSLGASMCSSMLEPVWKKYVLRGPPANRRSWLRRSIVDAKVPVTQETWFLCLEWLP